MQFWRLFRVWGHLYVALHAPALLAQALTHYTLQNKPDEFLKECRAAGLSEDKLKFIATLASPDPECVKIKERAATMLAEPAAEAGPSAPDEELVERQRRSAQAALRSAASSSKEIHHTEMLLASAAAQRQELLAECPINHQIRPNTLADPHCPK